MKSKNIIMLMLIFIVISNIPPISNLFGSRYCYRNLDASFRFCEVPDKGLKFKTGKLQFEDFKTENPANQNKKLYREFPIKPWEFWQWFDMLSVHERFTLPYLEPDQMD
jgi:hypothetical protein